MRLINRKKCDRHMLQPADRIAALQSLGREIQQPECSVSRLQHNARLLFIADRAVENRRGNPHLRQLRRLILH